MYYSNIFAIFFFIQSSIGARSPRTKHRHTPHAPQSISIQLKENMDFLSSPESIINSIEFTQSKYNPLVSIRSVELTNLMDAQYYGIIDGDKSIIIL